MRNILIVFLFLSCYRISNAQEETALEKGMKEMNVTINIPSYFKVSQNKNVIFVTDVTEKDPWPTLAQMYRFEPSYGATFFKVLFDQTYSIFEHINGEYLIFIHLLPGKRRGIYHELAFERIKFDFHYGDALDGITDVEEYQLSPKAYQLSKRTSSENV